MKNNMVIGLFSNQSDAENAIRDLDQAGYSPKTDISIMGKNKQVVEEVSNNTGSNVGSGAATGATTGGLIGAGVGLLIGIGVLAIPGGILIGGPIAAALGLTGAAATTATGALTGALAGGLVGALVGFGLPEEEAHVYENTINNGGIAVAVPTGMSDKAEPTAILQSNNATNIHNIAK